MNDSFLSPDQARYLESVSAAKTRQPIAQAARRQARRANVRLKERLALYHAFSSHQGNHAMSETTPSPPEKKSGFSPTVTYVLERAMLIATANDIDVREAAIQVLGAIEFLNRRLYSKTDEPR